MPSISVPSAEGNVAFTTSPKPTLFRNSSFTLVSWSVSRSAPAAKISPGRSVRATETKTSSSGPRSKPPAVKAPDTGRSMRPFPTLTRPTWFSAESSMPKKMCRPSELNRGTPRSGPDSPVRIRSSPLPSDLAMARSFTSYQMSSGSSRMV